MTIATREDVDQALAKLRELHAAMAMINAQHDDEARQRDEARAIELRPIEQTVEALNAAIAAWVEANRGQLQGRRLRLVHGAVGYRKGGLRVEYARSPGATLEALRARGRTDCILVTEAPDAHALKLLSPQELALVGVTLTSEERFYIELTAGPRSARPVKP